MEQEARLSCIQSPLMMDLICSRFNYKGDAKMNEKQKKWRAAYSGVDVEPKVIPMQSRLFVFYRDNNDPDVAKFHKDALSKLQDREGFYAIQEIEQWDEYYIKLRYWVTGSPR
jgi:hypothetical protein